jgi:hypothetical protein
MEFVRFGHDDEHVYLTDDRPTTQDSLTKHTSTAQRYGQAEEDEDTNKGEDEDEDEQEQGQDQGQDQNQDQGLPSPLVLPIQRGSSLLCF